MFNFGEGLATEESDVDILIVRCVLEGEIDDLARGRERDPALTLTDITIAACEIAHLSDTERVLHSRLLGLICTANIVRRYTVKAGASMRT
jgi:hypothetical protein